MNVLRNTIRSFEMEIAYLTIFLDPPLTILVPTFRTTSCFARQSLRRREGAPPLATSTCGVNQTSGSTHAEATAPHRGSRLSGTICPCQSVLPGRHCLKTKLFCTFLCQSMQTCTTDQILKEYIIDNLNYCFVRLILTVN